MDCGFVVLGKGMDFMKMVVVLDLRWQPSFPMSHCRGLQNDTEMVLAAPNLANVKPNTGIVTRVFTSLYHSLTYELPVAICKRFIDYFLQNAVQKGRLELKLNDGTVLSYGDGSPCGIVNKPVTIRVFEPWFFVKTALEYDLGLARYV